MPAELVDERCEKILKRRGSRDCSQRTGRNSFRTRNERLTENERERRKRNTATENRDVTPEPEFIPLCRYRAPRHFSPNTTIRKKCFSRRSNNIGVTGWRSRKFCDGFIRTSSWTGGFFRCRLMPI